MLNRAMGSGLCKLLTTSALAVALACPSVASAAEPRIVVSRASFEGAVDDDAREQFEARLTEGLAGDDFELVKNYGAACEDAACFETLTEEEAAEYAVAMTVSARDRVYEVSVKLVAADGREVAAHSEVCEICGPDEAAATVVPLAEKIRDEISKELSNAPRLSVTSTPSGAKVFIDDSLVGTTPLDVTVEPGAYGIRVGGDGLAAQSREIVFGRGERKEVDFTLEPEGASDTRRGDATKPHRPLIIAGGVTLGLGVGALGAGIPLIAIDGQQNKNRCSGNDIDENGRCRFSYETLELGIGLTAGGGALAIIGAVLLGVGVTRKKKARADRASASLLLSPNEIGVRVVF